MSTALYTAARTWLRWFGAAGTGDSFTRNQRISTPDTMYPTSIGRCQRRPQLLTAESNYEARQQLGLAFDQAETASSKLGKNRFQGHILEYPDGRLYD